MSKMKIVSLELENVKRVSILSMEIAADGLTVIGGKNGQGKTTVLDAICFALGGERYRPGNLQRDDSVADAHIKLVMSNGLTVERAGKNASLKVTDPTGKKGGQALLDSFCEELAINLPKFMEATSKEKAKTLLKIIGIGDKLDKLELEERQVYQERANYYTTSDQKNKFYLELPWFDGVPEVPTSASDLIKESQAILARNAEKEALRRNIEKLNFDFEAAKQAVYRAELAVTNAREEAQRFADACKAVTIPAEDESTEDIEKQLNELEEINSKVRANADKQKAKDDAEACNVKYNQLTEKLEDVRKRRLALLNGAAMPLPGLSIEDSELTLNGKKWDCMSSAEQLRASAAIVKALKPECGFMLVDKLEAMDMDTLNEFKTWLEAEGLQAIATRVSTGEECTIILEDGREKKTNEEQDEKSPLYVQFYGRGSRKTDEKETIKTPAFVPGEF